MNAYAVVLAGGSGKRMGAQENKVLLSLRGVPALVRAIAPFTGLVKAVVLVVRPQDEAEIRGLLFTYGLSKKISAVVYGGETRQESVYHGLRALPGDCDAVLVHDGARALITEAVIQSVLQSLQNKGSGVAAVQATDTIKTADRDGLITGTLPRERLYQMQTPQGFPLETLLRAHEKARQDGYVGTDDAALVERLGEKVYLCPGALENIKLTRPVDLMLGSLILQAREEAL